MAERNEATLAEYADLPAERGEAPVLRLCRPDDPYDPELLRLRDEDVPAVRVETEVERKRARARKGLFLPATALPEIQAAASRVSTARALGLWLTIRARARMEGKGWVRVRARLLEAVGLGTTWARSRAYAELERAGLIQVRRRKGHAPLVRLVPQRTGGVELKAMASPNAVHFTILMAAAKSVRTVGRWARGRSL